MKTCKECNITMMDNLNLLGELYGERLKLGKRLPKKIVVKAAVCSKCGKIELYTDDLKNIEKA